MFLLILIHSLLAQNCAQSRAQSFAEDDSLCGGKCAAAVRKLDDKARKLGRTQEILRKNEEYLKNNPGASASITIKVRSNILVSRLQIETIQNEKLILENEIQEKGCSPCLSKNPTSAI